MEIFELRYFLGVARDQNIHRASERLRVSPASLSKAIARLEGELAVKLFSREGRNIRLSDQGRLLQRRASEIVQLEESTRVELGGHPGTLQVVLTGPEILLSRMGVELSGQILERHPRARFEYLSSDDEHALERVERGEAHLAIVTADLPGRRESGAPLTSKVLGEAAFQTCVGPGHPLFSAARAGRIVPVEEVLKHPFASPSHPLLGKVGVRQSIDGWRDDRFPRQVEYLTSSLKLLEELVVCGRALAYLPDYFCERLPVKVLQISGCPYSCIQKVRLVARNPRDSGWLSRLF